VTISRYDLVIAAVYAFLILFALGVLSLLLVMAAMALSG
jgi:hypothetical protein